MIVQGLAQQPHMPCTPELLMECNMYNVTFVVPDMSHDDPEQSELKQRPKQVQPLAYRFCNRLWFQLVA
jgi:hypothetical protein